MIRVLQGDAREVLASLPDASVHCAMTSPPYLGLRNYGVEGQIGAETSPSAYIAALVASFREVRRVLRDDGALFVNLGDCYATTPPGRGPQPGVSGLSGISGAQYQATLAAGHDTHRGTLNQARLIGLKPKDLMMMPARVALALQDDGWWLRSQMPWVKRSCMPESITDRPTSALEYVYLLTKQERYFWDAEAIKKVGAYPAGTRAAKGSPERAAQANGRPPEYAIYSGSRNFRNTDLFFESLDAPHGAITDAAGDIIALDVNPQPFGDAHFATFPAALVRPLIQAGTSERGCCPGCGAPWVRQTEKAVSLESGSGKSGNKPNGKGAGGEQTESGSYDIRMGPVVTTQTLGWHPTCSCDAGDPIPCTVLDCFAGAGTTGVVADRLGRDAVLIELNPEYCSMMDRRIRKDAGMFAEIT